MKGPILLISLNTLQYFKLRSMLRFILPNIKHYLIIYVTYVHDFLNSCAGGDQDLCSKIHFPNICPANLRQTPVPLCRLLHQSQQSRDVLFPSNILLPELKKFKQKGNTMIFLSVPYEEQMEETIMTVDKLCLQNCARVSRLTTSWMNKPQRWSWRVQRPQRHLLDKENGAGSMPDSSRSSSGILEPPRKLCGFFLMQNRNHVTPMHW